MAFGPRSITLCVMVAIAAMLSNPAKARPQPEWRPGRDARFIPREVVVFPRDPAQSRAVAQHMREQGLLILARAPMSGMILGATPIEGLEELACEWMKTWPEVRAAERNLRGQSTMQPATCPIPSTPTQNSCNTGGTPTPFPEIYASPCPPAGAGLPNDPYFCYQWGMRNTGQVVRDRTGPLVGQSCWEQNAVAGVDVGIVEAWEKTTGRPEVVVAVVGTGIEYCDPDFDPDRFFYPDISLTCIGNDGPSYPCCPPPNAPGESPCAYGPAMDNQGHETCVASVLGAVANNSVGVAGVD